MKDIGTSRALFFGWLLLAVFLPLGLTLEALHALKVQVYLGSPLRRELWTLAHAHGNLLGILCLTFAAVGERTIPDPRSRRRISMALCIGCLTMPLGFFAGGVLSFEGDPSLGILLVPAGALFLVFALVSAAISARKPPKD